MNQRNIFHQYLNNLLSPEKKRLLDDFFEIETSKINQWNEHQMGNKEDVSDKIWSKISKKAHLAKPRKRTLSPSLEVAAAILILIFAGLFLLLKSHDQTSTNPIPWQTYQTVPSQKSTINLPDGSIVILNAGSSLSHPIDFKGDIRQVTLKGEAFFKVAPDKDKPFIVSCKDFSTQVLGTSFHITTFPEDGAMITVHEGKVLVQQATNNITGKGSELILYANEAAKSNVELGKLIRKDAKLVESIAWINGEVYMNDMSIGELTEVLARMHGVVFTFETPTLRDCHISGKLGKMSIRQAMEVISSTMSLEYTIHKRRIHFSGKPCLIP
ncbi:FecR family protein [Belliella kenyensis]|uniref:FecR family protein n=1 Tax=Belliella kenyensis TaxID=1472724 RepID=A0ABV8EM82_9BACT|nr:FecR domain-containing protein [Belliella kenyensis]MCH7400845.1 FecR domain-containing protein [Belliella kenyensis]MDN3601867.1 FecR domain-containing protein [Belliella kenyensis]